MNFRKLRAEEEAQLCLNGCVCEDWSRVNVSLDFTPDYIKSVTFSGDIYLGKFENTITLDGGIKLHSGIYNAKIHQCKICDNVYISDVANYIANYEIAENVFIENVNRIIASGQSTFGNGVRVSVLNETGGREVAIYDNMSSHIAYMMAMYRYLPSTIEKINQLVDDYASAQTSEMGYIGKNTKILNSNLIKNVKVGEYAKIEGVSKLKEGTLCSSQQSPVVVGNNVIAENFIFASGSKITDGVVLQNVYVGQSCHFSHLFSAHDSLFFANCACENGEAAAVFAGPYTVSMHKSSLLIAGMFSFLNAGSGSNQSNHMYKLGPIHQGIVERGSKTTSDSYILWPAKIGAFSLVMGRHVSHPDTSKLPFSYLIENRGRSYLVPGVNLKSVGTIRDAMKWPKRDGRTDVDLDYVNFNLLSPYTIGKMQEGIDLLDTLEATSGATADKYTYLSMTIEPRALRKGREYYNYAIDKFMGNSIIKRLENIDIIDDNILQQALSVTVAKGTGEWLDLSGLIMPKSEVKHLVDNIESGLINKLEDIKKVFSDNNDNYYEYEWTWVVSNMKRWCGKEISELKIADIRDIVKKWYDSVLFIDKMLYDDAQKEFSLIAKTGFGVDGSADRKNFDFEQVRGAFENDPFVKMVLHHITEKKRLGDELLSRLKK
ncbi:MAG: DUF4954 family protein [Muribaculaceae bacterium]|nr:DUF4954 family protein [Muribaculaceae bacterium]